MGRVSGLFRPLWRTTASALEKPFRDELLSIERLEERALALAASFTIDPNPRRRSSSAIRLIQSAATTTVLLISGSRRHRRCDALLAGQRCRLDQRVGALAAQHLTAALFLKPGAIAIAFGHLEIIIRACS